MTEFPPLEPGQPGPTPPVAGGGTTIPTPSSTDGDPAKKSWKQWAVAGGAAAVVAVVVGAGIGLTGSGSDSQSTAGAAANGQVAGQVAGGYGMPGQGGPGAMGGRGTSGTISAIDGGTITLDASDLQSGTTSTVTVKTTDDTKVTETVDGTASDLAEGDNVVVMGATADGVVTAQRVTDSGDQAVGFGGGGGMPNGGAPPADGQLPEGGFPGGGQMPSGGPPAGASTDASGQGQGGPGMGGPGGMGAPTAGTITSIDGFTMTVKTADGTSVKVKLTDDTTVSVVKAITLDDLAKGDTISVMGTTTDSTVEATTIRKGELRPGGFGGGPGNVPPTTGA